MNLFFLVFFSKKKQKNLSILNNLDGREVDFTGHKQIIGNTDTDLIILIIPTCTLFSTIILNVFGKTLCPCQSI